MGDVILSRFCKLTWQHGRAILSSALSGATLHVDEEMLPVLHSLRCPTPRAHPSKQVALLVARLESLGMLCAVDASGEPREPPALQQWEEPELSFHVASRAGKGATFRFRGRMPPEPLSLAPRGGETISLRKPKSVTKKGSFEALLAARRTRRSFADRAIALTTLGAFLHRAASIQTVVDKGPEGQGARGPYPSPGARHALELYLLLDRATCSGIGQPGLYHYRPIEHALELIAPSNSAADELRAAVRYNALVEGAGGVPIFVTARMARLGWKYEGIAYSLALKELGGLFQTLYLVAESLGLGACAVGTGPRAPFELLSGCDPVAEPQIGEFIIGIPRRASRSRNRGGVSQ